MSTTRAALRKAIEAYTAEGPDDGPNNGPEEKALTELLDAIQAFEDKYHPGVPGWTRIMAAVPVFLTASADQVRNLRVAWEASTESGDGPGLFDGKEPAERKPVAGWKRIGATMTLSSPAGGSVAHDNGKWWRSGGRIHSASSLEAAQLAAEDALFAIADAINALRCGR